MHAIYSMQPDKPMQWQTHTFITRLSNFVLNWLNALLYRLLSGLTMSHHFSSIRPELVAYTYVVENLYVQTLARGRYTEKFSAKYFRFNFWVSVNKSVYHGFVHRKQRSRVILCFEINKSVIILKIFHNLWSGHVCLLHSKTRPPKPQFAVFPD